MKMNSIISEFSNNKEKTTPTYKFFIEIHLKKKKPLSNFNKENKFLFSK